MSDSLFLVELGRYEYPNVNNNLVISNMLINIWIDLSPNDEIYDSMPASIYFDLFHKLGDYKDNDMLVIIKNADVLIFSSNLVQANNENCVKIIRAFHTLWQTYTPYYNVYIDDDIKQDTNVNSYNIAIRHIIDNVKEFNFQFFKKEQ